MLPQGLVRISDSPSNFKIRAIERRRVEINWDIKEIKVLTHRRFFEKDDTQPDGVGEELTGRVEFPLYECYLTANNSKLVNPSNGLVVTKDPDTNEYLDVNGFVVANPIGMYDFFAAYLSQEVSVIALVTSTIQTQDAIYKTWDK